MNTSGEVADLFVKEGIQITEAVTKLAGLGAKNLAAIIIALISEDKKLQGKTNLRQLLKSEKPLCILQIKKEDIAKFTKEAKNYGVLFTAVTDKTKQTEFCDIIAKQEDVAKLNYIMEKMGYPAPEVEPEPEKENEKADGTKNPEQEKGKQDKSAVQHENNSKNQPPRVKENPSESKSSRHGAMAQTDSPTKPSVRAKIEEIRKEQTNEKSVKPPVRSPEHSTPKNSGKRKSKKKGKSR